MSMVLANLCLPINDKRIADSLPYTCKTQLKLVTLFGCLTLVGQHWMGMTILSVSAMPCATYFLQHVVHRDMQHGQATREVLTDYLFGYPAYCHVGASAIPLFSLRDLQLETELSHYKKDLSCVQMSHTTIDMCITTTKDTTYVHRWAPLQ